MKTAAVSLFCLFFSLGAFSQNPGDNLFNSPEIHKVNIQFYPTNYWSQLKSNYESTGNQDSNIYVAAAITIDSVFLDSVGIRLKGNSSYNHPGLKKPIKISFDKYRKNQSFDKLKQLNLNNGYLDPTMMREKLMLDFLNENSLPAPRCTYAAVHFNNEYVGLFKMVEEVDKKFLKTHFGDNRGNLFKGDPDGTLEWKGEAQWSYYDQYDLKTNEAENDWSQLLRFIHVLNNSPMESFKTEVDKIFNSVPFICAWAANDLFVNIDSYFFLPHNYYLYFNNTINKFEWITWDVSVAFGVFPLFSEKRATQLEVLYLPIQRHKHPLTYKMLETQDYRKNYLNAMCKFLYNDFTEENLFPKIDSLAKRIRPYIARESHQNQMYLLEDFDKNLTDGTIDKWWYDVPGLKSFITNRRNFVIKKMCETKWSCVMGESIEDSMERLVKVYPNPAREEITVEISTVEPESRDISFRMLNLLGQTIFHENKFSPASVYTGTFSTDKLISGIYFFTAKTGCETYSRKIVIIK